MKAERPQVQLSDHNSYETQAKTAQLNHSQIPDTQKLREIINGYCCFKQLSFDIILYAAIATGKSTVKEKRGLCLTLIFRDGFPKAVTFE